MASSLILKSAGRTKITLSTSMTATSTGYHTLEGSLRTDTPRRRVAAAQGGLYRDGDDIQATTFENRIVRMTLLIRGSSDDDLQAKIADLRAFLAQCELAHQEEIEEEGTLEYAFASESKKAIFDIIYGEFNIDARAQATRNRDKGSKYTTQGELVLTCKPYGRGESTGLVENFGRNTHFEEVDESAGNSLPVGYTASNVTVWRDYTNCEFPEKGFPCIRMVATGGSGTNNNITFAPTWEASNAMRGRVFTLLVRYKWLPVSATQGFISIGDAAGSDTSDLVSSGTPSAETAGWRWAVVTRRIDVTATAISLRFDVRTANSATTGADELLIDRWYFFERPLLAFANFSGTDGDKLENMVVAGYGTTPTQSWNVEDDGWTIQSNKAAYDGAVSSQPAWIETFKSDVILEAEITTSATASKFLGLLLRYKNKSNFIRLTISNVAAGTDVSLTRVENGTATSIATATAGLAASTAYKVKVLLQGTSIKVFIDSVSQIDTTSAVHQTETKHGIFANNTGVTDYRWDDFRVREYAPDTSSQQNLSLQDAWFDGREIKNRGDRDLWPATDPQNKNWVDMCGYTDAPSLIKAIVLDDQAKVDFYSGVRIGRYQRKDNLDFQAELWSPTDNLAGATIAAQNGASTDEGTGNELERVTFSADMAVGGANYIAYTLTKWPAGTFQALVRYSAGTFSGTIYLGIGYSYAGVTKAPSVAAHYNAQATNGAYGLLALPQLISLPFHRQNLRGAPGNLELRLYIATSGITATNTLDLDYIFLMPANQFVGHKNAISAAQYTVLDRISKVGGVGIETANRTLTTVPSSVYGRQPLLHTVGQRQYFLANTTSSTMVIADTKKVGFEIVPRYLDLR